MCASSTRREPAGLSAQTPLSSIERVRAMVSEQAANGAMSKAEAVGALYALDAVEALDCVARGEAPPQRCAECGYEQLSCFCDEFHAKTFGSVHGG